MSTSPSSMPGSRPLVAKGHDHSNMVLPTAYLRQSSGALTTGSSFQAQRPSTPASATFSRTGSDTPHLIALRNRPPASSSQRASRSYSRAQSVVSSSNPLGQRGIASTASGRKSRATSSIWGSESHQIICAVSEARGVSPSVGLAFVNITTNEAILSQICDSQFYVKTLHKIEIYDPGTILMVNTSFPPNPPSNLLSVIEEEFRETTIEPMDRKYWSETAGLDCIHSLAFREDLESIKVAIQGSFYATCSFAAVWQKSSMRNICIYLSKQAIKYMELACHLTVMSHSLRVRYQPSENSMMIDVSTIHSLELIQNLQNAKSKHCLFGLLDETSTPMGTRMLRSNILQPSTQVEHTLSPRFDALDELTVKEDVFFEIRKGKRPYVSDSSLF